MALGCSGCGMGSYALVVWLLIFIALLLFIIWLVNQFQRKKKKRTT